MLRKLASQTFLYGSSIILARLINLAFTPIYTELFAPQVYGIFTNLYAYVAVINVLITFGMETTFFRYVQDEAEPKKVYGQAFAWVAMLVVLLVGLGASGGVPFFSGEEAFSPGSQAANFSSSGRRQPRCCPRRQRRWRS